MLFFLLCLIPQNNLDRIYRLQMLAKAKQEDEKKN